MKKKGGLTNNKICESIGVVIIIIVSLLSDMFVGHDNYRLLIDGWKLSQQYRVYKMSLSNCSSRGVCRLSVSLSSELVCFCQTYSVQTLSNCFNVRLPQRWGSSTLISLSQQWGIQICIPRWVFNYRCNEMSKPLSHCSSGEVSKCLSDCCSNEVYKQTAEAVNLQTFVKSRPPTICQNAAAVLQKSSLPMILSCRSLSKSLSARSVGCLIFHSDG